MKRAGVCANGGCERLGTAEVDIFRVGRKLLCYYCKEALTTLFGDMTPRPRPIAPVTLRPLGGAA